VGGARGRLVVLPPLPGRWFIIMLDRWLTPPANFRQASGFVSVQGDGLGGMEFGGGWLGEGWWGRNLVGIGGYALFIWDNWMVGGTS
jgi:hypothetical protein